jgi:hypothetical protein
MADFPSLLFWLDLRTPFEEEGPLIRETMDKIDGLLALLIPGTFETVGKVVRFMAILGCSGIMLKEGVLQSFQAPWFR